jgi:Ca2+-transporting ATPase
LEEAVPETATAGRKAPYRRTAEEVVAELGSDPRRGLSAEEARVRLRRYGPNELQERSGKGPWSILWQQFTSVMVIATQRSGILEGR